MKRTLLISLFMCLILLSNGFAQKRIALLHDGNAHDNDDIGALAMALSIVKRAEDKGSGKLVHCSYNNHHWSDHDPSINNQRAVMTATGTQGQSKLYPGKGNMFFNARTQLTPSVNHLAGLINSSGSGNLLYICTGGPQDQLYLALAKAKKEKLKYVRIISHSKWNNKHSDGKKTMQDIQNFLGAADWNTCYKKAGTLNNPAWGVGNIPNQNDEIWHKKSKAADFNWFKSHKGYELPWVHARMIAAKEYDVSDAGMVYWVVTGQAKPSWQQVKNFYGNGGTNPPPGDVKINVTKVTSGCNKKGKVINTLFVTVTGSNAKPTSNFGVVKPQGNNWKVRHVGVKLGSVTNYKISVGKVSVNKSVTAVSSCKKSAEEMNADISTMAYPNPAADVINITSTEGAVVNIYNVQGQVVYTNSNLNGTLQIPTSELGGKGLYILNVDGQTSQIVVK